MDAPAQLSEAINADGASVPLDVACDLIAQHLDQELPSGSTMRRIDALAVQTTATTFASLLQDIVHTFGFRGNQDDYYDPANSLLPHVIDRRLGIPITLAVVTIEVAHRCGLHVDGVGMPGHFLVRHRDSDGLFADPFSGADLLTEAGCRQRFRSVVGDQLAWEDGFLAPVSNLEIVSRMLNNLKAIYLRRSEVASLRRVLDLRACLPGMPPGDWNALAVALAARGRYAEAATELEQLADRCLDDERAKLLGRAQQLRAKLN